MNKSTISLAAAAAVAAIALAGCGGDGDPTPEPVPATTQVPGSANDSIAGMIAFLKELTASSADTLEPVSAATYNPPTSDTVEPTTL